MYSAYFGFREKPFKLVPNPEYLFLSKSHEEALAHLNFAIAQGDGFVEITGEVGTGKTTLCRAFLEKLDDATAAAYIFNPKLGPKQLIRTINDEFGIEYNADDTKDLFDKLNHFLIQKKLEREKAIVLIDEAQNLTRAVLEQLRLLSNLETNREKLLQIILVGQPELAEMLESYELRQLGQRISLRCQILPLNLKETQDYIQYRLNIASQKPAFLFTSAAIRRIYNYSRGIPRLINIACDRALLTAYGMNRRKVKGHIADIALAEMAGRNRIRRSSLVVRRWALGAIGLLCLLAVGIYYHDPLHQAIRSFFVSRFAAAEPAAPPAPAQNPTAAELAPATAPIQNMTSRTPPERGRSGTVSALSDYFSRAENRFSRQTALTEVLAAWGTAFEAKSDLAAIEDDPTFFNLSAKTAGFFVQRLETDLKILRNLNMPAILEFRLSNKPTYVYLALTQMDGPTFLFKSGPGDHLIESQAEDFTPYWTSVAFVPWKNFLSLTGTIPGNAQADSILALKMLLRDLGYTDVSLNKDYDDVTQKAIEQIQAKYGIPIDGIVGNLTKIILYREGQRFDIPRLVSN